MEDSALRKIIEAENEIRGRIESEKKRIDEELAEARKAASGKIEETRAFYKRKLSDDLKETEAEARTKAAEVITSAREYTVRLGSLDEEALRETVFRHLLKLLSGERP